MSITAFVSVAERDQQIIHKNKLLQIPPGVEVKVEFSTSGMVTVITAGYVKTHITGELPTFFRKKMISCENQSRVSLGNIKIRDFEKGLEDRYVDVDFYVGEDLSLHLRLLSLK
jgi:hypothetical protein